MVVVEGDAVGELQYETDRARFLGRGRGIRTPMSVIDGRPLSNTAGAVLDPIFSLRRRVRLAPGETRPRHLLDARRAIARRRPRPRRQVPQSGDVRTRGHAGLDAGAGPATHLGIDADEAHLFQELASRILYSDPTLRPSSAMLTRNNRGPSALWRHGISGDLPIVLVRIDEAEDLDIVRQLLRAHEYWRMKRLAVDLVILNEQAPSYAEDLQDALETLVRTSQSACGTMATSRQRRVHPAGRPHLGRGSHAAPDRRSGRAPEPPRHPGRAGARVSSDPKPPPFPLPRRLPASRQRTRRRGPELEFFNGLGGFAARWT